MPPSTERVTPRGCDARLDTETASVSATALTALSAPAAPASDSTRTPGSAPTIASASASATPSTRPCARRAPAPDSAPASGSAPATASASSGCFNRALHPHGSNARIGADRCLDRCFRLDATRLILGHVCPLHTAACSLTPRTHRSTRSQYSTRAGSVILSGEGYWSSLESGQFAPVAARLRRGSARLERGAVVDPSIGPCACRKPRPRLPTTLPDAKATAPA